LTLAAGWYVQITGDNFDLEEWDHSLNEPFDPVVLAEPDGNFLLRSSEFHTAQNAEEVREKAQALISRLNGAMSLTHGCSPVSLGGVIQAGENGARHAFVYAESSVIVLSSLRARVTATVSGPNGQVVPPPPPKPSDAQRWNAKAAGDDKVADLLEQLGKAKGWYEIYKTIEFASHLAGGERELWALLGSSAADCKKLKQTANFYRHARAPRPANPTPIGDAKPLLDMMVRKAIEAI
jgi:hypothetical protein